MLFARVTSVVALLGAVVLLGMLFTRSGDDAYTLKVQTVNAGQIVPGNEVRIGGARVGRVRAIDLTGSGLAAVTLDLDAALAPLHEGTTFAVRQNSLVGSANRYVTLTPGPLSRPALPDDGVIRAVDATAPVDFDAVLDTLDAPTRDGLRGLVRGGAQQYHDRVVQTRDSLRYLAPALSGTTRMLRELASDRDALNRLVTRGAVAARAVNSRSGELADLIGNATTTTQALASESDGLSASLRRLPTFLNRGRTTLTGLRSTIGDLDPLLRTADASTPALAPFLRRVRPLLQEAVPVVDDLAATVTARGADNDLIDLFRRLPSTRATVRAASPRGIRAMDRSQREVDALLDYMPDAMSALSLLNRDASYYDANGHYFRVEPDLNAFRYDAGRNQLFPEPVSDRLHGVQTHKGNRCPGGAAAGTAAGVPQRQLQDCDPNASPPR